jgi:hypothetical protein
MQDVARKGIIFIADPEAVLPPVALALQDAGMAAVVADGGWDDRHLVTTHSVDLGECGKVQVRLSELIHSDGTSDAVADVTVAKSEDGALDEAMERAIALARNFKPQPTTRQVLPPIRSQFKQRRYAETRCPAVGLRLLALFKVYNVIEHFFPYKDLMDSDWDEQLRNFIPRFEAAGNAIEYALAIAESSLISRILM